MSEFTADNIGELNRYENRLNFLMEAASQAYADADDLTQRDEEGFHIIAGLYEVLSQELKEGNSVDMENKISKFDARIQKFISNIGKTPDAIH